MKVPRLIGSGLPRTFGGTGAPVQGRRARSRHGLAFPMPTLAETLRAHWPAYRTKFGNAIPPAQRAAVRAILNCRTPARGGRGRRDRARAVASEISRWDGVGGVRCACFATMCHNRTSRTRARDAGEGAKAIYKDAALAGKTPGEVRAGSFNRPDRTGSGQCISLGWDITGQMAAL